LSIKPETLLAQADFVRRLACNLVADDHLSADIAQDALLLAWRKSSSPWKNPSAWFSRIIRNLSISHFRSESRRREREKAVALPEKIASPEEIVELEEVRGRVVEAVLSLEEIYRTTIILRYYHDLPHKEVAKRLDIPLETMRSRLKKGHALLKNHLDAKYQGDRKKWVFGLAPFFSLNTGSASVATVFGSTAVLVGGIAMATKLKVAVVALVMIAAMVAVLKVLPFDPEVEQEPRQLASGGDDGIGTSQLSERNRARGSEREPVPSEKETFGNSKTQQIENRVPFTITVLTVLGKKPVTDFQIIVKGEDSTILLDENVEDAEGHFGSTIPYVHQVDLIVKAATFATKVKNREDVHEKEGLSGLILYLQKGIEVTGIVLDHASQRPVAGARVMSLDVLPRNEQEDGHDLGSYGCVSEQNGRFILEDVPDALQTVVALHPDYAEGLVNCRPTEPIIIELFEGHVISGYMRWDDGSLCPGGIVSMRDMLDRFGRKAVADAEGFYHLPRAAPGEHFIHATGPLGHGDPGFTPDFVIKNIIDSDATLNFGPTPADAVLEGFITTADDQPVPEGASVYFVPLDNKLASSRSDHDLDEKGFYQVRKLRAGRYAAHVSFAGMGGDVDLGVIVIPGPGTQRKNFRLPGGIVAGRVLYKGQTIPLEEYSQVQLWDYDYSGLRSYDPGNDGAFRFLGVRAGKYRINAHTKKLGNHGYQTIELEENEVLDNLELVFTPRGTLQVRLLGWEKYAEMAEFKYSLRPIGGKRSYTTGGGFRREDLMNGEGQVCRNHLEPGEYEIAFDEFDLPRQRIWIYEECIAEVLFDIRHVDQPFTTLSGLLKYDTGVPLGGAYVILRYLHPEEDYDRTCYLGPDGRFELPALRPGTWKMRAVDTRDSSRHDLPDLIVPDAPPPRIEKVFIVEKGES